MYELFTDRARKVMALANHKAQQLNHKFVGTEHLLLALVKEGTGFGVQMLKGLNLDPKKVRAEVVRLFKANTDITIIGVVPLAPGAEKVIEYATEEARNLNLNYVGTEHLLLGLLREYDGVAAQVLTNLGIKLGEAREKLLEIYGIRTEEKLPETVAGYPYNAIRTELTSIFRRCVQAVSQQMDAAGLKALHPNGDASYEEALNQVLTDTIAMIDRVMPEFNALLRSCDTGRLSAKIRSMIEDELRCELERRHKAAGTTDTT
ncbi:MAG: Clp protease N-terminal domain-containing protein [Candidatus Paceibacterota bacterium]